MIDLEELIKKANELEPLPASTVRLAQMVSSPDCHIEDVAELIGFDQALTVRLLRAVNSAVDGGRTEVTTARDAVLRLGTARVLTLAVAASAKPLLQAGVPAYGLSDGALWRHSVAAAVAAEIAPSFCLMPIPPETFTAALLHDIGKLVMGRFISPEILGYIQRAEEVEHLGRLEAESLLLNVHHGELGGLIAQHWNLPARVIQAITHHHHPEAGMDIVCDVTYIANRVAKSIEAGLDGERFDFTVDPGVAERLGLLTNSFDDFCRVAGSRYIQVSRRYNAS